MKSSSLQTVELKGVRLAGLALSLPEGSEDCLEACTRLYGDAERARNVVQTTGVLKRRVCAPGETALGLCIRAAERCLTETGTDPAEIGAVLHVSFTPERLMPCGACVAQARLGLPHEVVAFDLNLACSGWLYGVYVAGLLAKSLGRKVLLLDGDGQSARLDTEDAATRALLADAGTAALLSPETALDAPPFLFSFLADGAKGDALQLPFGGTISMDGLAVFRFVTTDVLKLLRTFLEETGLTPDRVDAFVPHQANVFLIEQLARRLSLDRPKLKVCADILGNASSASVPSAICWTQARGTVLAAGFGGGLSAAVGCLHIDPNCPLLVNRPPARARARAIRIGVNLM